jgi:hypothetical protein
VQTSCIEAAQKVCWSQKYVLGIQTTTGDNSALEPLTQKAIAEGMVAVLEIVEDCEWIQQCAWQLVAQALPLQDVLRLVARSNAAFEQVLSQLFDSLRWHLDVFSDKQYAKKSNTEMAIKVLSIVSKNRVHEDCCCDVGSLIAWLEKDGQKDSHYWNDLSYDMQLRFMLLCLLFDIESEILTPLTKIRDSLVLRAFDIAVTLLAKEEMLPTRAMEQVARYSLNLPPYERDTGLHATRQNVFCLGAMLNSAPASASSSDSNADMSWKQQLLNNAISHLSEAAWSQAHLDEQGWHRFTMEAAYVVEAVLYTYSVLIDMSEGEGLDSDLWKPMVALARQAEQDFWRDSRFENRTDKCQYAVKWAYEILRKRNVHHG